MPCVFSLCTRAVQRPEPLEPFAMEVRAGMTRCPEFLLHNGQRGSVLAGSFDLIPGLLQSGEASSRLDGARCPLSGKIVAKLGRGPLRSTTSLILAYSGRDTPSPSVAAAMGPLT
jgi:hypothetical protein